MNRNRCKDFEWLEQCGLKPRDTRYPSDRRLIATWLLYAAAPLSILNFCTAKPDQLLGALVFACLCCALALDRWVGQ